MQNKLSYFNYLYDDTNSYPTWILFLRWSYKNMQILENPSPDYYSYQKRVMIKHNQRNQLLSSYTDNILEHNKCDQRIIIFAYYYWYIFLLFYMCITTIVVFGCELLILIIFLYTNAVSYAIINDKRPCTVLRPVAPNYLKNIKAKWKYNGPEHILSGGV